MKRSTLIISVVVFLALVISMVIYINSDKHTDSKRFALEYTEVSKDNVFVYRNVNEIINILRNGTGVVYLGFPECSWCQAYVTYLNEAAKETGIEKIYYYNILEDRTNNTEEYMQIVSLLKDHLQYDEEGEPRVYVPNVSFVIRGEIIGNDYETSLDTNGINTPSIYWTEEKQLALKNRLINYMNRVVEASMSCTNCNN